jgi:hypothetical protein
MASDSNSFSWKGLIALIVILIIVSVIAFVLSSIESFLAGVVVIFIGFLLSFFRDDLKRMLGLSSPQKEPTPLVATEESPTEQLDKMVLMDLDKKIAKERQKIAKTIAKYNEKPKKQEKLGHEIVEECSALLALIDRAKSQAIQMDDAKLVQHYVTLSIEVESTRDKYVL